MVKPLRTIVRRLGIPASKVMYYGQDMAKIDHRLAKKQQRGKLIVVTSASTPTRSGSGKTTMVIGLADALNKEQSAIVCLRQPSLGPLFGIKGGATGGGRCQLHPADKINIHFTGDFHAVSSAHNLLVAMTEAHIQRGNALNIDITRPILREAEDVNNRGLRTIIRSPDGHLKNEYTSGFDITAACETMAILALAKDMEDLKERITTMVVAYDKEGRPIRAREVCNVDAIAGCLIDAINPNLVQTLEGNPALVHTGPFGNIAHGCSSVIATSAGLAIADYVVTEAGFAEELGMQKFVDIMCRSSGLRPDAVVAVVNIRDLKRQGGQKPKKGVYRPSIRALTRGLPNLHAHLDNLKSYFSGEAPIVVALNRFANNTRAEITLVKKSVEEKGFVFTLADGYNKGSAGMKTLAKAVRDACANKSVFRFSYNNPGEGQLDVKDRVEFICRERYGVNKVLWPPEVKNKLKDLISQLGDMEVCIAKGFLSITTDDHVRPVAVEDQMVMIRDIDVSAGAGFYVILTGKVFRMPGLPTKTEPRANQMRIVKDSTVFGGYHLEGV